MIREPVRHRTTSSKGPEGASSLATQGTGLVQVENGVCFGPWQVAGKTVDYVRQQLATPYNIHPDAVAVLNGELVRDDAVLRPGDTLAFEKMSGFKGLTELLTPEQLMQRWRINREQYEQLLHEGLPVKELQGAVLHPEVAVDEWFRQMAPGPPRPRVLGREAPSWCHAGDEEPPATHRFGPLVGTQKQLVSWLYPDGKQDPRRLHRRAEGGRIWVRKCTAQCYEVWFTNQTENAEANARRLENETRKRREAKPQDQDRPRNDQK